MQPRERFVNPDLLGPMVEQPESSSEGDWYVIPLETLIREGYTHIEFHFPYSDDGLQDTNMVKLVEDPTWRNELS